MKKTIISLALALLGFANLYATKAKTSIAQLTLADGTTVSAMLHGDESFHYYALLDGTPLKRNEQGKYVVSNTQEMQSRRQLAYQRLEANRLATRATGIGKGSPSYFPHTGSPKALVILVQFQDVKFKSSDPVATFDHYLNADMGAAAPSADAQVFSTDEPFTNYGSVKEYFKDSSLGKFTPQFDVVGPVTVSQKSEYYGADNEKKGETDENFKQMISEACGLVASKVDFSNYDSDNDNYVDLVYIIYAGYSQSFSGNSDDCLWPKSGTDYFYKYNTNGNKLTPQQDLIFNGKRICRYGINNEINYTEKDLDDDGKPLLNGIGVFCHEFSHTMGFSDHYETEYTGANNQTPEYWDLMDAGEYTQNGYRPTPYTPWEKMMMGWMEPTTLDGTQAQQLTLQPYDIASQAFKIDADVTDENFSINSNYGKKNITSEEKAKLKERAKGEYLLLQNIRNEGWYKYLPGYGMLVWRIDYSDIDKVGLSDLPNNDIGIPRIMIVPADGMVINQANTEGNNGPYTAEEYWESLQNDPFPAYKIGKKDENGNETDINSLTEVKFNWSTMTSRPLYNIVKDEATGVVTFDYLKDFSATGIKNAVIDGDADTPTLYHDLEGRRIEHPVKNHLYITNKGKKIIY